MPTAPHARQDPADPALTFLGGRRLLPALAVLLDGDVGEGDEAEQQAGCPQRHAER